MDIQKLEAYKDNEAFIQDMEKVSTIEELKDTASRYGIELSDADIHAMTEQEETELSLDDLDNVAGGAGWRRRRIKIIPIPYPPFIRIVIVYY